MRSPVARLSVIELDALLRTTHRQNSHEHTASQANTYTPSNASPSKPRMSFDLNGRRSPRVAYSRQDSTVQGSKVQPSQSAGHGAIIMSEHKPRALRQHRTPQQRRQNFTPTRGQTPNTRHARSSRYTNTTAPAGRIRPTSKRNKMPPVTQASKHQAISNQAGTDTGGMVSFTDEILNRLKKQRAAECKLAIAAAKKVEKRLLARDTARIWAKKTYDASHTVPVALPKNDQEFSQLRDEAQKQPATAVSLFVTALLCRIRNRAVSNRYVTDTLHPSCRPGGRLRKFVQNKLTDLLPALASFVVGTRAKDGYDFNPNSIQIQIDTERSDNRARPDSLTEEPPVLNTTTAMSLFDAAKASTSTTHNETNASTTTAATTTGHHASTGNTTADATTQNKPTTKSTTAASNSGSVDVASDTTQYNDGDILDVYICTTGALPTHAKSRKLTIQLHDGRWYVRSFDLAGPVQAPRRLVPAFEALLPIGHSPAHLSSDDRLIRPDHTDGIQVPIDLDAARRKRQNKLMHPPERESSSARVRRHHRSKIATRKIAEDEALEDLLGRVDETAAPRVVVRFLGNGGVERTVVRRGHTKGLTMATKTAGAAPHTSSQLPHLLPQQNSTPHRRLSKA